MAFLFNRRYLGIDISEEYIKIAKTRLIAAQNECPLNSYLNENISEVQG
jgi:DNA modification methylase